jgi:hypothetical protein
MQMHDGTFAIVRDKARYVLSAVLKLLALLFAFDYFRYKGIPVKCYVLLSLEKSNYPVYSCE